MELTKRKWKKSFKQKPALKNHVDKNTRLRAKATGNIW